MPSFTGWVGVQVPVPSSLCRPCESKQIPLWGKDAWIRKVFAFAYKAQADCQPGCSILLLQTSE